LKLSRQMKRILDRMENGQYFVIAAVNGQALGGGCEILTACHYRIATENVTFSFRQAANGVITEWGGGVRLIQQIGRSCAMELLLTSRTLTAAETYQIGLVEQVVPAEQLMTTAMKLVQQITSNPAPVIQAFLQLFQTYLIENFIPDFAVDRIIFMINSRSQ